MLFTGFAVALLSFVLGATEARLPSKDRNLQVKPKVVALKLNVNPKAEEIESTCGKSLKEESINEAFEKAIIQLMTPKGTPTNVVQGGGKTGDCRNVCYYIEMPCHYIYPQCRGYRRGLKQQNVGDALTFDERLDRDGLMKVDMKSTKDKYAVLRSQCSQLKQQTQKLTYAELQIQTKNQSCEQAISSKYNIDCIVKKF